MQIRKSPLLIFPLVLQPRRAHFSGITSWFIGCMSLGVSPLQILHTIFLSLFKAFSSFHLVRPMQVVFLPLFAVCRNLHCIRDISPVCSLQRIFAHNLCRLQAPGLIRYRRLSSIAGTQYPARLCPLTKTHCWSMLRPVNDGLVSRSVLLESASCLGRRSWSKRPLKLHLSH